MRGLIEKDIRLLTKQKRFAVIYVFVALMLSFSMDSSFIVSYFSLIGSLLVLSTLSYDSYDNGYPFLMSLPVDAKTYVCAKYAFSILGLSISWAFAVILQFISQLIRNIPIDIGDSLSMDLAFFPVFILIIALMIPLNLKFGPEKSRIVLIVIFGLVMAVALLGQKILDSLTLDLHIDLESLLAGLNTTPKGIVIGAGLAAGILVLILSLWISIKVMENKEY